MMSLLWVRGWPMLRDFAISMIVAYVGVFVIACLI
jgi:hypothetical protein